MIERYTRPEMKAIWAEQAKIRRWIRVEAAASAEFHRLGLFGRAEWSRLKKKLVLLEKRGLPLDQIAEQDRILKHDVLAFTTVLAKRIGKESRFVHYGLTSSDVLDTAQALAIGDAGDLLLKEIRALAKTLNLQARRYRHLPTIGRTHGMFAEPTSFGLKFLSWAAEMKRNEGRIARALEENRYGKLSGAVGASPHLSPRSENRILSSLGLKREPVSTQVLPRDRLAELFMAFAVTGSSLERIATELRHLQRSEVSEVREGFSASQKGSSAMPHKQNPISSENLTGCARLLRSYVSPALENVVLWHERDISHSAVERVILPDAFTLLHYALGRMNQLVGALVVDEARVRANLASASEKVYSGHLLLRLIARGVSRERAYAWMQDCALSAGSRGFAERVLASPQILRVLKPREIRAVFNAEYALRHVDAIFREAARSVGR